MDKDKNCIYRVVAFKNQVEDVIKALRRGGFTAREFVYNYDQFIEDEKKCVQLREQLDNCQQELKQTATLGHQELFVALMHFKVIRAYIDGVLRFSIPPVFFMGVVMPSKGHDKKVLNELMKVTAEKGLEEMYGEKNANDAAFDSEDFWPFVSIPLSAPLFIHQ